MEKHFGIGFQATGFVQKNPIFTDKLARDKEFGTQKSMPFSPLLYNTLFRKVLLPGILNGLSSLRDMK
jgi:hypothetical protein